MWGRVHVSVFMWGHVHMCVYVGACPCECVYVGACPCECVYVGACPCECVYVGACSCECVYVGVCPSECVYVGACPCECVYVGVCSCECVYVGVCPSECVYVGACPCERVYVGACPCVCVYVGVCPSECVPVGVSIRNPAICTCLPSPDIAQDTLLEEKTKRIDALGVFASVPRKAHARIIWRNGLFPLMNFTDCRPQIFPRGLPQSQEDLHVTKTPTPEPMEVETRKIIQMNCNLERKEDRARWHLTLYLKLEDKMHRHLSCDLLPDESCESLASELVQYGFISQEDRQKMALFLEEAFHKQGASLH
uniref:Poly(U)-binding-splicing factor 60KDa n=1 Tax=Xenopus tropicalis TaxID=8364 RepID=A0A803KDH3_XENTR